MKKLTLLLGGAAVAVGLSYKLFWPLHNEQMDDMPMAQDSAMADASHAMVQIEMPQITGNARIGQQIFETTCAACHGTAGTGNAQAGPPLIHKIYEPSHHGDEAFQRAVAMGVRAHHWQFGNMPPQEGLTRGDMAMVVDYIRTIQRANGIH